MNLDCSGDRGRTGSEQEPSVRLPFAEHLAYLELPGTQKAPLERCSCSLCWTGSGAYVHLNLMVGPEGFEPSTNGLRGHCSTVELQTHYVISDLATDVNPV